MEEPAELDWIEWFKANCPKISANFRELFAANLLENQVTDVDSLKENLEIDPTFLKTVIGVKNAAFELSIKVGRFPIWQSCFFTYLSNRDICRAKLVRPQQFHR